VIPVDFWVPEPEAGTPVATPEIVPLETPEATPTATGQEGGGEIPVVFLTPEASSAPSSEEAAVTIGEEGFDPDTLEITAGTTVTWTNADDAPHTVTSHDDVFTSSGLVTDETFSFTFDTPGTYTYFDNYRPELEGTIIVTEP
jgi:plastocyanin